MRLEEAIEKIEKTDKEAYKKAYDHWLAIAKPLFSLGKFESMISQIAAIKGRFDFKLDKKALIIMCSDNGVVEEGVTQTGQEVTATVTGNFAKGETSVCVMAEYARVDIFPIDIGVAVDIEDVTDKNIKIAYGTKNMTKGPAMTRQETIKGIELGIKKVIELKEKGYEIIATGEMGIGNTTTSSAISSVMLDIDVEKITGKGAGLSSEGLLKKIDAIKRAIEINKPDKNDPIDVLSKVGGLDIAGLVGVFLGGAMCKIPIVIDGFISGTAAMLAFEICPISKEYMLASHVSKEIGGHLILDRLGLSPVITADMCLGEGSGAVALFPLLDMAYGVYSKMKTFYNWNGTEVYHILN